MYMIEMFLFFYVQSVTSKFLMVSIAHRNGSQRQRQCKRSLFLAFAGDKTFSVDVLKYGEAVSIDQYEGYMHEGYM